jgi:hypothetical protein
LRIGDKGAEPITGHIPVHDLPALDTALAQGE